MGMGSNRRAKWGYWGHTIERKREREGVILHLCVCVMMMNLKCILVHSISLVRAIDFENRKRERELVRSQYTHAYEEDRAR